jgi:hypothetical protein
MTRFASRADMHYFAAFIGGLTAVICVGVVENFISMYLPAPLYGTSIDAINYQLMLQTCLGIALGLVGYAGGFFGLAYLLRRLGGRPLRQGVRLGAVVATLLLAALVLTGFTMASLPIEQQITSPNLLVWQDFATILAIGGFYMAGWFLATHYGKDKL